MAPGRWGILGAAAIADGALVPAIRDILGCSVEAIASRSGDRARAMAAAHSVPTAYDSYSELLARQDIDHIYVALPNSLHCEWTVRALQAGKNVLCEKPLAVSVREGRKIAAVAAENGRLVMEALMYRFNERTIAFVESAPAPRYVHASFSYPQTDPSNIRLRPELGGGALADLGCYTVSVVRWLLGEPDEIAATAHVTDVDISIAASLAFEGGPLATLWASFETPASQMVTVVGTERTARTAHHPFGAWFDPNEPDRLGPYRAMVTAFMEATAGRSALPLPLEESLANLEVMGRIRQAAGIDNEAVTV